MGGCAFVRVCVLIEVWVWAGGWVGDVGDVILGRRGGWV